MIIKCLSRPQKTAEANLKSFSQLFSYISNHEAEGYRFYHNLKPSFEPEKIINQFVKNSYYLKSRKNGKLLSHDVLSLKYDSEIPKQRQLEILYKLTQEYIQRKAGENLLAYSTVHTEVKKGHIHSHIVFSSNFINSEKKHRFSKIELKKFQFDLQQWLYQEFPEVQKSNKSVFINPDDKEAEKKVWQEKENLPYFPTDKEIQIKKRTGNEKKTIREQATELLQDLFTKILTPTEFKEHQERLGIEFYERGKYYGVKFQGSKFRLHKLEPGLPNKYQNFRAEIEKVEKRQNNLYKLNQAKNIEREGLEMDEI